MWGASMQIPFGNSGLRRLQFGGPSLVDSGKNRLNLGIDLLETGFGGFRIHYYDVVEPPVQKFGI